MTSRKDGLDTRQKLLDAASAVFAAKGYRDTTIAEICRKAHSNVAAVNYHFGGKDALYTQVWRRAFDVALEVYPPDGGLGADAPPAELLRALIHAHLHRVLDDGRLGYAGQILLRELVDPTDVIEKILMEVIKPLRQRTWKIISDLLGPRAGEQDIHFCLMSVIHQCFAVGFCRYRKPNHPLSEHISPENIDILAEHITRFSLAGIAAVREKFETTHDN
ncbi:MAG: CerR family C-terminal domain-containing protein [Sedimentisphaerales bacterium]|nr:CerR family C-terminal domain-containing protein [Sedimentisphaerales bacterium]